MESSVLHSPLKSEEPVKVGTVDVTEEELAMTTQYPFGTSEKILAIIPNTTLKAGFMGVKTRQHSVVFTDRRILFARVTVARMKELTEAAKADSAGQGKGRVGGMLSNPHVYDRLTQLYLQMGPDGVLADNAANFAVDRAAVKGVKLKSTAGPEGGVGADVLVIKTSQKTYKLDLGGSKAEARQALETAGLA